MPVTMPGSVARVTPPGRETGHRLPRPFPGARRPARMTAFAQRLVDRDGFALLALAGVVVGIAVLIGRTAVSNHHVFIDEFAAINFGRAIAIDPSLIDANGLGRGPERAVSLITALIDGTSDSLTRSDVPGPRGGSRVARGSGARP